MAEECRGSCFNGTIKANHKGFLFLMAAGMWADFTAASS